MFLHIPYTYMYFISLCAQSLCLQQYNSWMQTRPFEGGIFSRQWHSMCVFLTQYHNKDCRGNGVYTCWGFFYSVPHSFFPPPPSTLSFMHAHTKHTHAHACTLTQSVSNRVSALIGGPRRTFMNRVSCCAYSITAWARGSLTCPVCSWEPGACKASRHLVY